MAKKHKTKRAAKKPTAKKAKKATKQNKRQSAFAKFGTPFDQGKSLIVLRRGSAIDKATIFDKKFAITTDEGIPLNIPTNQIDTIILKNLPQFPLDVIRLDGNEISGTITTDPVHANSPQVGGDITIPLADILSIIF